MQPESMNRSSHRTQGRWRLWLLVSLVLIPACDGLFSTAEGPQRPGRAGSGANQEPAEIESGRHSSSSELALARRRIKHFVFIIKENRTFDHFFGRMSGVDGSTTGETCDGTEVSLKRAADIMPNDILHSFRAGLVSINGGRMNCFDEIFGGTELQGYVQYRQKDIPNYWAYAKRYTLADRFFSSVYGPTNVEHLWTLAAQSDRFVDTERPHQEGTDRAGEYCNDRLERMYSFRRMSTRARKEAFRLEELAAVEELAEHFWIERWPCTGMRTPARLARSRERLVEILDRWRLPSTRHQNDQAHPVRAHVGQGRRHPEVRPIRQGGAAAVGLVARTPGPLNDHPASGSICRGENWTVGRLNLLMKEQVLAQYGGDPDVGRLRGLLRPRCSSARRSLRIWSAGSDHRDLAVGAARPRGSPYVRLLLGSQNDRGASRTGEPRSERCPGATYVELVRLRAAAHPSSASGNARLPLGCGRYGVRAETLTACMPRP
jgi:hypothetical protein